MASPEEAAQNGTPAIYRRRGDEITVWDLDTAAYVFYKRVPIANAYQVNPTQFHVVFYDPEHRAEALSLEFANTEVALYADAMHRLKKVMKRLARGGAGRDNVRSHNGNRSQ